MKPTYLYIKQHTVTWKLYFGKTVKTDPVKYLGSGTHWVNHIKKHGKEHVVTLWYCLFTSQEDLTAFALKFSEKMDIVKSDQWLNQIPENGLSDSVGGMKGKKHTEEWKLYMSNILTGQKRSPEACANVRASHVTPSPETYLKIAASLRGQTRTVEQCLNISNSKKDIPQAQITCPHCNVSGGSSVMKRWHFDRCKEDRAQSKISCPHCGTIGSGLVMHRYHFNKCRHLELEDE